MRSKTWWIRSVVVLAAVSEWLMALTSGGIVGGAGKSLLIGMSIGPILVAAFCGVVTTADSLAREKRERTIELLLLTKLHPLALVLQKLIASTAPRQLPKKSAHTQNVASIATNSSYSCSQAP